MTQICFICREKEKLGDTEMKTIQTLNGEVRIHTTCFATFKSLIKVTLEEIKEVFPQTPISQFIKVIDEKAVLVRRDWSAYSIPILAYLDYRNEPVIPSEVYTWLTENEVKITNPSQYVKELIRKGHLGVIKKEGDRRIFITDTGRKYLMDVSEEG